MSQVFSEPISFEWDAGNSGKNFVKHAISNVECEEVFMDTNKYVAKDPVHSAGEDRYLVIGKSKEGNLLFVAFTLRQGRIRVISARITNRKERKLYE